MRVFHGSHATGLRERWDLVGDICVYMCIYICVYIMRINTYIYICIYNISICIYIYTYVYGWTDGWMDGWMHGWIWCTELHIVQFFVLSVCTKGQAATLEIIESSPSRSHTRSNTHGILASLTSQSRSPMHKRPPDIEAIYLAAQ